MSFVTRFKSIFPKSQKKQNDWEKISETLKNIKSEESTSDISENLFTFLITGEDHRFWTHFGVDPISLARATFKTIVIKKREGGSTIAMQLVRTITKRYETSPTRKINEIYLAIRTTLSIEKKEILKAYLHIAYFGWNMHGLEQACKELHLNKSSLTDIEAASIIARLKYPEPKNKSQLRSKKIKTRAFHIINKSRKINIQGRYGTV